MKNSLPFEAPWWAEFLALFRMSKGIFFTQPPYTIFLRYYEKSFTFGSVLMSRIQKTLKNVEVNYIYAEAIYWFCKKIMKNPLSLKASWWAEFWPQFRMSKFLIFMQPSCINCLRYYQKSATVASVEMNRIQNYFHNVEVY